MTSTSILLSINPRFTSRIFEGAKSVELRRVRPRLQAGDTVYIYESAPTMAVVGYCKVRHMVDYSIEGLWRKVKDSAGLSREDFIDYFSGAARGFGIYISDPVRFVRPLQLVELRQAHPGFHPPQSHRYVKSLSSAMVTLLASAQGGGDRGLGARDQV